MATEYEKQLEEEIISLKALLDARTKELDELKTSLEKHHNSNIAFGSGINIAQMSGRNITTDNWDVNITSSSMVLGGVKLTTNDIENLHHLWSLHMQNENNPPLLYKIWRKIKSCLNMKKN